MPASPASKAPKRASDLRPSPLDISRETVIELDGESPNSPPVSAGPIIRDKTNEVSTFGIKLQKLERARDQEASGTSTDLPTFKPGQQSKEESK